MKIILILAVLLSSILLSYTPKSKVKVKQFNNITNVKILINNPMVTPHTAELKKIEQNYIKSIKIKADDKLVVDMKTSYYLSKNPILKFRYKTIDATTLHVEAVDNKNKIQTFTKTIIKRNVHRTISEFKKLSKKQKIYQAKSEAVKELFGDIILIEDGIDLQAPGISANGGSIPISIRSGIEAKSVVLFSQSENIYEYTSEDDFSPINKGLRFTCQWLDTPYSIVDYHIKIKMRFSGDVRVVIEAKDGKFYTAVKYVEVAVAGGN